MNASSFAVRRGAGLPVYLVHGFGVDHHIMLALDPVLEAAGSLQRNYLDLPGFGGTAPLPGAGLPQLADWLEAQIRQDAGGRQFALVGNSLGGLLAQEMAERFTTQVAGLALLAPVIFPEASQRTLPPRRVVHGDKQLLASLDPHDAADYAEMAVVQTKGNWQQFRRWVLPGLRSANLRAMARIRQRYYLEQLPVQRSQPAAGIPVLALCGRQDHVAGWADARLLAERYPQLVHEVLDPAGHNVHLDQPEAAARALEAWARSL